MPNVTGQADCVPGSGAYSAGFDSYVRKCISNNDLSRLNNLFSIDEYRQTFDKLSGISDDLIISNKGLQSQMVASNMTTSALDKRLGEIQGEKEKLTAQLNETHEKTDAADRSFLDSITTQNTPQNDRFPTLQDIALAFFFFGWFVLGIVLIYIRAVGATGSLKSAALSAVLFVLVTMVLYALLKIVA